MTGADIATAEPRKLAEALRRECATWSNPRLDPKTPEVKMFAAALLAVLDKCKYATNNEPIRDDADGREYDIEEAILRAAALAYVEHGGRL